MADYVGGQAVIEGVMMRYKDNLATAVSKKNKIIVKKEKIKFKSSKIPFIRGIINLIETLYIGVKTLNYSAEMQLEKKEKKSSSSMMVFSLIFAFVFALFLFKFMPLYLTRFIDKFLNMNSILFNLLDGIIKISIFILYIHIISKMSDIKKVFQYHGAEHKAVNCYESGLKLNVKNVKKFSTVHKRCGTTFILLVLTVSIIVYMFIPKTLPFSMNLLLRILLLPFIASISYELLRLNARYDNMITGTLVIPGLLLQKMTTKEPNDKQINVAIKAINAVL